MLETVKKYWPIASTLLLLVLLASLIFWQEVARQVSTAVLVLGIGMAILFSTSPRWQKYQQGKFTRRELARSLVTDIAGLLLTMSAAILAGGWAGRSAGQFVQQISEHIWLAILAAILAGFAAGFVATWLARRLWRSLFAPNGRS
jgi:hypothetical protein